MSKCNKKANATTLNTYLEYDCAINVKNSSMGRNGKIYNQMLRQCL